MQIIINNSTTHNIALLNKKWNALDISEGLTLGIPENPWKTQISIPDSEPQKISRLKSSLRNYKKNRNSNMIVKK